MHEAPRLVSLNFRLGSSEFGLDIGIRLRQLDGRWLAVAEFDNEPEVGIGASARAALAGSLARLGDRAASALLADPELMGVSARIGRSA